MAADAHARGRFTRTPTTWAAYLLLGYFAYLQTLPGPLLPFLQRDLHLSYSAGGLHVGAFASGIMVAGFLHSWITARVWGRWLWWGGAAGMAMGGCGVALGQQLAETVASCAVMGLCGGTLLITIQTVLALTHGARRAQALTEANVMASLGSSVAALAVGALSGWGLSWRLSALLAVGVLALLAACFRDAPLPRRPVHHSATPTAGALPALFWLYWAASLCGLAAEACLGYWGAAYLHGVDGLPLSTAATLMSLYLAVGIGARVGGSWAVRRWSSRLLLVPATLVALVGFLVFWRASAAPVVVAGLCLAAVGIANLFPFSLATVLGVAQTQAGAASARLSLGAGLALLVAPLVVGAVADRNGLQAAYGLVPLLLGSMLVLTVAAAGAARRPAVLGEQTMPRDAKSTRDNDISA